MNEIAVADIEMNPTPSPGPGEQLAGVLGGGGITEVEVAKT